LASGRSKFTLFQERPAFSANGPQSSLWAGSRVAHVKLTQVVIKTVYTQLQCHNVSNIIQGMFVLLFFRTLFSLSTINRLHNITLSCIYKTMWGTAPIVCS